MSATIDLKNPGRPIHAGVVLMGGLTELLDVAPIDCLHGLDRKFIATLPEHMVSDSLRAQALDFEFHWVAEDVTKPSLVTAGIKLLPTDSFETCPKLDIVLVGAAHGGYEPTEAELAFLRKAWSECAAFITVCGGMIYPMKAGILNGKTATAPREMVDPLRSEAPDVNWVKKRWVRDGKLWTSGTLLNGLDLMTNFCRDTWGGEEGSLIEATIKLASWPDRDVDFKDEV